jgi:hypothetical protein
MSLAVIDKVHDIFVKISSMYTVPTFRVFFLFLVRLPYRVEETIGEATQLFPILFLHYPGAGEKPIC